jgi:hypothetical protein
MSLSFTMLGNSAVMPRVGQANKQKRPTLPASTLVHQATDTFLKGHSLKAPSPYAVRPPHKQAHPMDAVTVKEIMSDQFLLKDKRTGVVFRPNLTNIKVIPRVKGSEQGLKFEFNKKDAARVFELRDKHTFRDKHEKIIMIFNVEEEEGPFEVQLIGKRNNPFTKKEEKFSTKILFDGLDGNGETKALNLVQEDHPLVFNYRDYLIAQAAARPKNRIKLELIDQFKPAEALIYDDSRNYAREYHQEQLRKAEESKDGEASS